MNVLWHSTSFSGVLWRRCTGSAGVCTYGIQHCCSWAHSSHCASECGREATISELPRHMQGWYSHCSLLLCFCTKQLTHSYGKHKRIYFKILASLVDQYTLLPPLLSSWNHISAFREELLLHSMHICLWHTLDRFFHCKYTQMSRLMNN